VLDTRPRALSGRPGPWRGQARARPTCGGSTFSSWMLSIWPSLSAAPRMRHSASASRSALASVRYLHTRARPCLPHDCCSSSPSNPGLATAHPASRQASALPCRLGCLLHLRQCCSAAHAGPAHHSPLVTVDSGLEKPADHRPTKHQTPPARQQVWALPCGSPLARAAPAPERRAPVGRDAVRRRRLARRRAAEVARHAVRHGAIDQAGAQAREAGRAPECARRHRALAQLAAHLLLALRHGCVGLRRAPCGGSCT